VENNYLYFNNNLLPVATCNT